MRCSRAFASTAASGNRRVAALRSRLAQDIPTLHDFLSPAPMPSGAPHPPAPRSSASSSTVAPASSSSVGMRTLLPSSRAARVGPDAPVARPALSPALIDRFSRKHTYLRISLTERCSLRCVYCMPEEGVALTPSSRLLSRDEMLRLARLFVSAGVGKIRLTGGEPTVRRDLPEIIGALDELRPLGLEQIALTSNGIALPRMLRTLVHNGLDRLNLSLDTLDRQRFKQLTRRDGLRRVLDAIDLAIELGLSPLKINCVLMTGTNDDELLEFAALTRTRPIDVRFIEYMPFDGNKWSEASMVPFEVRRTLTLTLTLSLTLSGARPACCLSR